MQKTIFYIFIGVILTAFCCSFYKIKQPRTTYTPIYFSNIKSDENLSNIQCPIPFKDRVINRTQTQCVWASIEMLGRWAEEKKLIEPPLTSRSECQSYATPSSAANVLKKINVKFEQSYGDRNNGIKLIKKAMTKHRGCLWGIQGHAMVLIHYDEEKNIIKWVDNSDANLAVQTSTVDYFNKVWVGWVLVIYADNDIINEKRPYQLILIDMDGKEIKYDKNYFPIPQNTIPVPFLRKSI